MKKLSFRSCQIQGLEKMEFLVSLCTYTLLRTVVNETMLFESNNVVLIPDENNISDNIFQKISLELVKAFR
jgi:hypothetical protein